jgi:hypothetical protein
MPAYGRLIIDKAARIDAFSISALPVEFNSYAARLVNDRLAICSSCRIIALGAAQGSANSQEPSPLQPGARVRVKLMERNQWIRGELLALGPDSLLLATETENRLLVLGVPSIDRFQLSQGKRSHTGEGALLGLVVGVGAGLVVGLSFKEDGFFDVGAGQIAGLTAMFGGIGIGVGAATGALVRTDQWTDVPKP